MDLRATYDAIRELQADLRFEIQANVFLDDAYKEIKALSATYELQEYLANRIAAAVNSGELEPDPED